MDTYMKCILVYVLVAIALVVFGIIEKKKIAKAVSKIDLRVNVNGIRGKSTATRFITAILEAEGYRVVGKTTGTSARMILWGREKEIAIKRRPVGANIGEQISVLKKAAKMNADALVCECMAVKPEYQIIYQSEIVHGNVVVLTNVVEDHLDEMGPTTDQISWAFANTIPYNGTLVITKGDYSDYFIQVAQERNTKVVCVDPEEITDEYLNEFPFMVFKNNCAIGLGFARAMGIDEERAKRAMLNSHPDPGATQIVQVTHGDQKCYLVNAFAANEPSSSLEIWGRICEGPLPKNDATLILCCRDDRVDRTHQFVEDFLPYVNMKRMLVIGTGALEVVHEFKQGKYPGIEECVDLSGQKADVIIDEVYKLMNNNVFLCVGNIHGSADEFLEEFAAIRI